MALPGGNELRPDTGLKIVFFKNDFFIDIITSKDWSLLP